MIHEGLLILRIVVGGLLAGHGAQKLFGVLGGPGLAGTAGWLESIGLRPGRPWALMAGLAELAGGLLMALGLLHPLGPIAVIAAMLTAWLRAHWGKPIWATQGGGELPLTNAAVAIAVALAGPGAYSIDQALGIQVPPAVVVAAAVAALLGVVAAIAWPAKAPPASRTAERRDGRAA
jgi:putative oxidoreductase